MSRKKCVSIPAVAIRSIFPTLLVRDGPFQGPSRLIHPNARSKYSGSNRLRLFWLRKRRKVSMVLFGKHCSQFQFTRIERRKRLLDV
jgi:hypothetical protein